MHYHFNATCHHCGKAFRARTYLLGTGRKVFCNRACCNLSRPASFAEICASRVVRRDGCWGWTGKIANGYGMLYFRRDHRLAHRFSWEVHVGPIPPGMWVLHRCDNPICTNPAHLFLGTCDDNTRDREEKGRGCHGSRSRGARLDEATVAELRRKRAAGEIGGCPAPLPEVARGLGITLGTLRNALRGKTWKHVR